MKILLTGANGQLGRELIRESRHGENDMMAFSHEQLDISDSTQTEKAFADFHPELVINAAAYTHVDNAETEQELAFAVNHDGTANLARCCAENNIPLIHVSTDYVFDGRKGSPYVETDPVSPLGIYGKSKEQGEQAVRSCLDRYLIVRTAWLYSVYRHNFVKTMLRLGKEREMLQVVMDQHGSPTCAADLAEAILAIVRIIKMPSSSEIIWGTYHYCDSGITTWHAFAEKIFEFARQYTTIRTTCIKAITSAEYPTPVTRPAFSVLDCAKIRENFGVVPPPWEQSLKKTVERLCGGQG